MIAIFYSKYGAKIEKKVHNRTEWPKNFSLILHYGSPKQIKTLFYLHYRMLNCHLDHSPKWAASQ